MHLYIMLNSSICEQYSDINHLLRLPCRAACSHDHRFGSFQWFRHQLAKADNKVFIYGSRNSKHSTEVVQLYLQPQRWHPFLRASPKLSSHTHKIDSEEFPACAISFVTQTDLLVPQQIFTGTLTFFS